jgi:YVTN family beta-propeller protein
VTIICAMIGACAVIAAAVIGLQDHSPIINMFTGPSSSVSSSTSAHLAQPSATAAKDPQGRATHAAHVATTISVGTQPDGVAVDPAASAAYIANWNGDSVSIINTATNTVTASQSHPRAPTGTSTCSPPTTYAPC